MDLKLKEVASEIFQSLNNSGNETNHQIMDFRHPKTLPGPLLTVLLASTLIKMAYAKSYGSGYGQSPWIPLKHLHNYINNVPSFWQPIYKQTTPPPQIQPPPLNQQQIIHIYDSLPVSSQQSDDDDHDVIANNRENTYQSTDVNESGETNLQNLDYPISVLTTEDNIINKQSSEYDDNLKLEYDNDGDSTNVTYSIVKFVPPDDYLNETETNMTERNYDNGQNFTTEKNYGTVADILEEEKSPSYQDITIIDKISTTEQNIKDQPLLIESNVGEALEDIENKTGLSQNISEETNLQNMDYSNLILTTEENIKSWQSDADKYNNTINQINLILSLMESNFTSSMDKAEDQYFENSINTNKRPRRTTPRTNIYHIPRKSNFRKPLNDYDQKTRYRTKPSIRRTTTANYNDYHLPNKQANRRKRKPAQKNKKFNRRPVNREPDYYDSEYKDDDYYDDYYQNGVNIFARQGTTESDTTESTSTTTVASTQTTQTTQTTATATTQAPVQNMTQGYTYGPPIQNGYGPPGQTGYGPPGQTGYGPSNGNEHISITYPPMSGPGRDVLGPLFDNWYNQYAKTSILKKLQELLQPSNYYNNPQYDSYDNF